jgi:hypothetical protein
VEAALNQLELERDIGHFVQALWDEQKCEGDCPKCPPLLPQELYLADATAPTEIWSKCDTADQAIVKLIEALVSGRIVAAARHDDGSTSFWLPDITEGFR